jgi:hypothetical protein
VKTDDGRHVEQGVDEMLHLKIANALLDHPSPGILVLVTGDGRDSQFDTGFPIQARRAIKNGWDVEVYSWKCQLSNQFRQLESDHPGRVSIHELDQWYLQTTFVREGGTWTYPTSSGASVTIEVKERVVAKL